MNEPLPSFLLKLACSGPERIIETDMEILPLPPRPQQKIVIKVEMPCDRCRSKALSLVAATGGVHSVALAGDARDQVVVVGDGVDPVRLAGALRRKAGPRRSCSSPPRPRTRALAAAMPPPPPPARRPSTRRPPRGTTTSTRRR